MNNPEIKALLLDVESVLLQRPQPCFFDTLEERYGIDVGDFFQTTYQQCLRGNGCFETILQHRLLEWGWVGTVEDFLHDWFLSESNVQYDILLLLLRCPVLIFFISDNTECRMRHLLERRSLGKICRDSFFSCSIGYCKSDDEYWEFVLRQLVILDISPNNILCFDGHSDVVETACEFGLHAYGFQDIPRFQRQLLEYGVYSE